MRVARNVLNRFLKSNGATLRHLDGNLRRRVVQHLVPLLAAFDLPVPRGVDEEWIFEYLQLVADAVVRTPYGEPLRFDVPLIATISTTSFCPFPCVNCYSSSTAHRSGKERGSIRNSVERLARSQTPFVIISGGEPLASSELPQDLRILLDAGKFVYLSTNASIRPLTPLIEEYRRRLMLVLPVWGNAERQDGLRGAGSQSRLESNIEILGGIDAQTILLVVVSDHDLSIFDNVETLCRSGSVKSITIIRKINVGRGEDNGLAWTEEFQAEVRARMRVIQPLVAAVDFDVPELRESRFDASSAPARRIFGIPPHVECAAGNWMVHIGPGGVAYPCFSFESNEAYGVDPAEGFDAQWMQVRKARAAIPTRAACIGEEPTL